MTKLFIVLLFLILLAVKPYNPHPVSRHSRRSILKHATLATLSPCALLLPSPALALPKVPTVQVGSVSLSRTIQGYWQLAGGHGNFEVPDVLNTMNEYYKVGVTSFDTADIYGASEGIVGRFSKEAGCGVNTKLCVFDASKVTKESVRARVVKSREKLGKVDVMQFFWSDVRNKKFVDVALWLAELREEGMFGELGVTNFDLKSLKLMQDAGAGIKSNQVQSSCLDRRVHQSGQASYCADEDIKLISFGSVGSGILSDRYIGRGKPTANEQDTYSMRMYSGTANRFGSWELVQELLGVMDAVAKEVRESGRCRDCNISNVAQRYVLQTDPTGGCLLIGVRNARHVEENVRTHSFELDKEEVEAIQTIVNKRAGPKGDVWDLERGFI